LKGYGSLGGECDPSFKKKKDFGVIDQEFSGKDVRERYNQVRLETIEGSTAKKQPDDQVRDSMAQEPKDSEGTGKSLETPRMGVASDFS
jgi:hypothetical protein